jgi:hypothetical protein
MQMYVPEVDEDVLIQTRGDNEENFAATILEVLPGERVRVERKDGLPTARLTYDIGEIELTMDNGQRDRYAEYWDEREGRKGALPLVEISELLHVERPKDN